MRGGIVFFRTRQLDVISRFYREEIGCELWLDQGGCHIFKFGNMLFGLCQRKETDNQGIVTFVFPNKKSVDSMYSRLSQIADEAPRDNADYRIYHFFARDPDGRAIEFQYFWDEMPGV